MTYCFLSCSWRRPSVFRSIHDMVLSEILQKESFSWTRHPPSVLPLQIHLQWDVKLGYYFKTTVLITLKARLGCSGNSTAAVETKLLSKDFWESWRLKIAGLDRDVSSRWMTQERGVGASQQGIRLLTLTGDITGRCGRNTCKNFQAWQTCPLRRRQSFMTYKLCISFLLLIIRKLPGASCQR